jgi:hypothetical protein
MKLKDKIPPIYHGFFPDFMELEFPEEKIATCADCTLCRSKQSPYINTKCCNYYPKLTNYLIGGLLLDNSPQWEEGRKRIRRLIAEKRGVTPYGLIQPTQYSVLKEKRDKEDFWKKPREYNESLLCPFYSQGSCTIWKYRESLCVTFFCSSVGGSKGNKFWRKVNDYLKMTERELSKYALMQLGWPVTDINVEPLNGKKLGIDDENGKINEPAYAECWKEWKGKEEDFFKRCHEVVMSIDIPTFQKITGLNQEILLQSIYETNNAFWENILPERLILNPDATIESKDDTQYTIANSTGSVDFPKVFLPLIKAFNGRRSTAEVCHFGYKVMAVLIDFVEEMYRKEILIAFTPEMDHS